MKSGNTIKENRWLIVYLSVILFVNVATAQTVTSVKIKLLNQVYVAGDTLKLEVRIYNNEGLIKGAFCANARFQDAINGGENRSIVISGNEIAYMNKRPEMNIALNECFTEGIDTVKVVLYKETNKLHRIWASIGNVEDSTELFRLLPGKLEYIKINNNTSAPEARTIELYYPNGNVMLNVKGYDKWNNEYDQMINCSWSTNGSLHQIEAPYGGNIFYSTGGIASEEEGEIIAKKTGVPELVDTVRIIIKQSVKILKRIEINKKEIGDQFGNFKEININIAGKKLTGSRKNRNHKINIVNIQKKHIILQIGSF